MRNFLKKLFCLLFLKHSLISDGDVSAYFDIIAAGEGLNPNNKSSV